MAKHLTFLAFAGWAFGSIVPLQERAVPLRNQTVYTARYQQPSNSTPKFNFPVPQARLAANVSIQQEEGTCAPGLPCTNGACCNNNGVCGYGPEFCGGDVCISNCDAQAQCGPYAPEGEERCPLNVCCSIYGFCGTTDEFCLDKCDETSSECGPAPEPQGKALAFGRNIGYYESWATTRPCDAVRPNDLDVTGLTHLNFAFAFFHPTTFQITAMDSNAQSLLREFTELKFLNSGLQTWIAIGGWSFNDPGNSPDTRTAFSDMASSAANRQTFIQSLLSFMDNFGFDGADIDWEYPSAEDRGGRPEDKENFVLLCQEMKAAFGGRYGLSITLPASFWYLRHFDVAAMEPHVDWFNVMTYDIHGVWDSGNQWTGAFARPHTNLTEIDDALSLLWRAGVNAGNVVLGMAYYGRSFTLSDPSCTEPGCPFEEGARAGECSKAAGILTMAEIGRIIEENEVYPEFDAEAAVKWITWDSDQWVSYEDEETFALKMDYASGLGLGGTMIWAIDQGIFGTSNDQYLGISALAQYGITKDDIVEYKQMTDAGEACYVSFCGDECQPGYTSFTQMRGQIGSLGPGSACDDDNEFHQLCCVSGGYPGRCYWSGWRGEGMSCYGGGCVEGDILMTQNSNNYFENPLTGEITDETCNGGLQAYCCRGFRSSPQQGRDLDLIEPEEIQLHDDPDAIAKRDFIGCAEGFIIGGALLFVTGPLGWLAEGAVLATFCAIGSAEGSAKGPVGFSGPITRAQSKGGQVIGPGVLPPVRKPPPKSTPKQGGGTRTHYGRYQIASWAPGITYCSTTYTCDYGEGFDQVCDNQRYALEQLMGGLQTVFHYAGGGQMAGRMQPRWSYTNNHAHYRRSFTPRVASGRQRCEVDEFPQGSLLESGGGAIQALRAIDGTENGGQGADFNDWLRATWYPCSSLMNSPPPINWEINTGALGQNDPRRTAATTEFIRKYGFDSSSGLAPCYATYTTPSNNVESVISDHGYRVFTNDPMFTAVSWPSQNYKSDPATHSPLPTSVNSQNWVRRDFVPEADSIPTITAMADPPAVTGDAKSMITTIEARVAKNQGAK